jgi:hypothetical protein
VLNRVALNVTLAAAGGGLTSAALDARKGLLDVRALLQASA